MDRSSILPKPKAKVTFPRPMPQETALKLLQLLTAGIPTSDWNILKLDTPTAKDGEQTYILQIN